MTFTDLFSKQAADYARHRPTYPAELFDFVASAAPTRAHAWDCATGNGQAAHGLRSHFDLVIGTDGSPQQIERAVPGDGIEYRVATAEASGLPDQSVDAVTVATALHWFDLAGFYAEVSRVLRPQGVIAVWTYASSTFPAGYDEIVREFVNDPLHGHWAPGIQNAWNGYAALDFPYEEVAAPSFEIRRQWTALDFANYVRTWSAAQAFKQVNGAELFAETFEAFERAWGKEPVEVVWPLDVRVGRVS